MVETRYILMADEGPRSNPLLYGVAEALACLFPLDEQHFPRLSAGTHPDLATETAPEAATSAQQEIVTA